MTKYNDYPLQECADAAEKLIRDKGATIYQKFTCRNCGSRQTMAEPNKFYTSGKCEECGFDTDIAKQGCNFMLWQAMTPAGLKTMQEILAKKT